MEYRIIENKTANYLGIIGVFIMLFGMVFGFLLCLASFYKTFFGGYGLTIFFLSMILSLPFFALASYFSTKEKDTKIFLNEIRNDLKKCNNIKSLLIIRKKLTNEAIDENNMIRISFPISVKEIIKEIDYKIDILETQQHTLPT